MVLVTKLSGKTEVWDKPTLEELLEHLFFKMDLAYYEERNAYALQGIYPINQGQAMAEALKLLESIPTASKDKIADYYLFYRHFISELKSIMGDRFRNQIAIADACTSQVEVWEHSNVVVKEGIPLSAEAEFKLLKYYGHMGFSVVKPMAYVEIPAGRIPMPTITNTPYHMQKRSYEIINLPKKSKEAYSALLLDKMEGRSVSIQYSKLLTKKDVALRKKFIKDANNFMLQQTAEFHETPPLINLKRHQLNDNMSLEKKQRYLEEYYGKSVAKIIFGEGKTQNDANQFAGLFSVDIGSKLLEDFIVIHVDPSLANTFITPEGKFVRMDLLSMIDYNYRLLLSEGKDVSDVSPFNYHYFYDDLLHIFDHGEQLRLRALTGDLFDEAGLERELYKYWMSREKVRLQRLGKDIEVIQINEILGKLDKRKRVGKGIKKSANEIMLRRIKDSNGDIINGEAAPHLKLDHNLFLHRYYRNTRDAKTIDENEGYLPARYKDEQELKHRVQELLRIKPASKNQNGEPFTIEMQKQIYSDDTFDQGILSLLGFSVERYRDVGKKELFMSLNSLRLNISREDFDAQIFDRIEDYIENALIKEILEQRRERHLDVAKTSLKRAMEMMVGEYFGEREKSISFGLSSRRITYSFESDKEGYVLRCNGNPFHKDKSIKTGQRYQEHLNRIGNSGLPEKDIGFLTKMVHLQYLT